VAWQVCGANLSVNQAIDPALAKSEFALQALEELLIDSGHGATLDSQLSTSLSEADATLR